MVHRTGPSAHSASSSSGDRSVAARDLHGSTIITGDIHVSPMGTLAWDCSARISNFLRQYIGTPDNPVTFGGRDDEITALTTWLADTAAPPYMLFAAPAGRGKSALLAQWIHDLHREGDGIQVIFFPVSIRYRTNLAGVVFPVLATHLAKLHGEEVGGSIPLTTEMWRGLVGEYLARPMPDGRRLLVVLDGLDEAADWRPGPDLFPLQPPPGLRVVASARLTTAAPTPRAWLERLGWDIPRLATTPGLPPLSADGVAAVLQHVGFSLPDPTEHGFLVSELHRLSQGDPLLVRLYVDELRRGTPRPSGLSPAELTALDPGLEGFFNRWWEDQRLLWDRVAPLREPAVRALLNLLACALAPLRQVDMLGLAPEELKLDTWALEEALQPLERFVVGDGRSQGYVFTHPKLGQYFYERLAKTERTTWDQRFLAWGKEVITALERSELTPAEVPPYLLQYLGVHLERAGARLDELIALISQPWLHAWLQSGAGISGFLSDVSRGWRVAAQQNQVFAEKGEPLPHLGTEVLCALCQGSDSSRGKKLSPLLLRALVETGIWNPLEGLVYARRFDVHDRVTTFATLLPLFPLDEQARLLREMFALAQSQPIDSPIVHKLCTHWTNLPASDRAVLELDVLQIASTVSSLTWRVRVLSLIARVLSAEAANHAVQFALKSAGELASPVDRAVALATIEEVASGAARQPIASLLKEATRFTYAARLRIAAALLPVLEADARPAAVAALVGYSSPRTGIRTLYDARALALVLPYIVDSKRQDLAELVAEWVPQQWQLHPVYVAEILARIVPYLAPDQRSELMDEAVGLLSNADPMIYLAALDALLETLPAFERGVVLSREVAAAREGMRPLLAQLGLLRYLEPAEHRSLAEMLRAGAGIRLDEVTTIDDDLWHRVGPSIREIGNMDLRIQEEIEAQLQIDDAGSLIAALGAMLPRLQGARREEAEEDLLRTIFHTWNSDRRRAIAEVASVLSRRGLDTALKATQTLPELGERAATLAVLLRYLPRKVRKGNAGTLWRLIVRLQHSGSNRNRQWGDLLVAGLPHIPTPAKEHAIIRLIEIARRAGPRRRLALLLRALPHARGSSRATIVLSLAVGLFSERVTRSEQPLYVVAGARLAAVMAGVDAEEVLEHVRRISWPGERALAMAALVPFIDEAQRVRLAAEAVSLSRRLPRTTDRVELWYDVAVHLTDPALSVALLRRAQREIEPVYRNSKRAMLRLRIIIALLPYLPDPERQRQLRAAIRLSRKNDLPTLLLQELAGNLPLKHARKLVGHVISRRYSYVVNDELDELVSLRAWMGWGDLTHALDMVRRSARGTRRVRLLALLAPHFPHLITPLEHLAINHFSSRGGSGADVSRPKLFEDWELPEVDTAVLDGIADGVSADVLTEAAEMLNGRPRTEQYRALHDRLHAAAKHSRTMVLKVIETHLHVFNSLANQCLPDLGEAMLKAQRWWP